MRRNTKETWQQFVLRLLPALIIFPCCLIIIPAIIAPEQTMAQGTFVKVTVPDREMEQIVRRILVYSFKPRNKATVVHLAEEGIKQSWLPKIKNVEFRLLKDEQLQDFPNKENIQKDLKYYFFNGPYLPEDTDESRLSEAVYQISFAFGFRCKASSKNWHFRISNQKIKLWQKGNPHLACGG